MIKNFNTFITESEKYEFGCVMLESPIKNWDNICALIDPNDLYIEEGENYGIQKHPHITLLYGLDKLAKLNEIEKIVSKFKPFEVISTGIDFFENDNFDVVKFSIRKSDEFEKIYDLLSELPNQNEFPDFSPHITIGYVKKGLGKKYKKVVNNNLGLLSTIKYSDSSGKDHFFTLK